MMYYVFLCYYPIPYIFRAYGRKVIMFFSFVFFALSFCLYLFLLK